ncbi:MAG TPA: DUF349 domain-containing protein, partial [Ramlibacter sp.]|nr:DUF349 domain-containing protein [Ramlibacter sp.]
WDAFRKPIDEAFNRKTEERERAAAALSERDRAVLEASKALEAANATGDAQKIRAAMSALDAALKGQAEAKADKARADAQAQEAAGAAPAEAPAAEAAPAPASEGGEEAAAPAPAPAPAAPPKKPVIAMRGDDRPGMKKAEPAPMGRGGKFGDRRDFRGGRDGGRDDRGPRPGGRFGDRPMEDRGPRLGDVAFRAQREALEHAQAALKKLAAQAHGEALTQLLTAWEQRSAEQVPSQSELGRSVTPAIRGSWLKALQGGPSGEAGEALLRLEIAAEVPTPADQIAARRQMQLLLLTRRNDPSPVQTWGEDTARVLATRHEAGAARRLQNVLKVLLR